MAKRSAVNPRLFYILTFLIFAAGLAFWLADLTSDPPMYYAGYGQSLSTDPAQYVHHARNEILFGDFDPFDYPRWTVYQHSLTSLTGWLWFSIAGVSIKQAAVVGLILCLGGLIFLILGLARYHRPWVTSVVTLCYVINITLYTHGRLSYLENGLIFIAALLFFVYSRWGDRLWGVALSGLLVAIAMLTGKLFGALLLPALLLAILFSGRDDRWRRALVSGGAFLIGSLALMLMLYGTDLAAAMGYVGEQSYGLRGFPKGLTTPWDFVEHLISYGFKNRLYYKDPDLYMFFGVTGLLLIFFFSAGRKLRELKPTALFAIFWIACSILGLMPLNYSPIRYTLLFIPAILIACFTLMDSALDWDRKVKLMPGKLALLLTLFFSWFGIFHLIGNVFFFNTVPFPTRTLTWTTLPGAIVLTVLFRHLMINGYLRLSKRVMYVGLGLMIGLSLVANGFRMRRDHYLDHNFNLMEANQEIGQILGEGAVLSGPYAAALTLDNKVKSFIHLFGVANVDTTLFDRYPVTHIAAEAGNWKEAVKQYPQLEGLMPITTLWIRDFAVGIYYVSQVFENPQANAYRKSGYETALDLMARQQLDSARVVMEDFYRRYPYQKSGGMMLANIWQQTDRAGQVFGLLTSLADKYPTDFNLQMQTGRYVQAAAIARKDNRLLAIAQKYYLQSTLANRFKADVANRTYMQMMQQTGGR